MDNQLIEQLQTIQKYISTMFDSLPLIQIKSNGNFEIYGANNQTINIGEYSFNIPELIGQNIAYGRKIIQLSDKFTAKYRKDHFVDRKDIEEKIVQIYRCVCPAVLCNNLDEMVNAIYKRLEGGILTLSNSQSQSQISQSRASYQYAGSGALSHNFDSKERGSSNNNTNLNQYVSKQSKIQYYRDQANTNPHLTPMYSNTFHNSKQPMTRSKLQLQNNPLQLLQNPSESELNTNTHRPSNSNTYNNNNNQSKRRRSTNKSKTSKNTKQDNFNTVNNITTKQTLQIKNYFEQQQSSIRKIFQKITKLVQQQNLSSSTSTPSSHPNPKTTLKIKISQQNRTYTKLINQNQKDNFQQFVHANIENNRYNLNKIYELINVVQEYYAKRSTIDGLIHGKFNVYIDEINKRQEIFSFTVSKLMENIGYVREYLESREDVLRLEYGDQQQDNQYHNNNTNTNNSNNKSRNNNHNKIRNTHHINPLKTIQTLQQITNNFYDLYPSHSILKDLKIQVHNTNMNTHRNSIYHEGSAIMNNQINNTFGVIPKNTQNSNAYTHQTPHNKQPLTIIHYSYNEHQLQKIGYKNQGVQVCLGYYKNQKVIQKQIAQSKRNLLELFKTQTKINEMIEKFQRSIKFKKNIQVKEIQKFVQSVRDSFSKKSLLNNNLNANNIGNNNINVAAQVQNYQEQLHKIIETNQKNQKELAEQYSKKSKKYEKQIQQLQKTLEQIITQNKKQQQKAQTNLRKMSKKLQAQKQQSKKIIAHKTTLQKNIKQMSHELQQVHRQITQNSYKFQQLQSTNLQQNLTLKSQLQSQINTTHQLQSKINQLTQKHQEQCQIYHQKIIFLQTQQQTKNQQYAQLQQQLQEMIKENTLLKKQVQQLTQIYEQKIKELQEVIDNIRELQDQLKSKQLQNIQYKQKFKINQQIIQSLQRQKKQYIKQTNRLQQKYKQKQAQCDKYREMGVLNESDINILRQQMDKVKQAYIQSQEQLEEIRNELDCVKRQKEYVVKQNRNYRRELDGCVERLENKEILYEKLEKQVRENFDQINLKRKQLSYISSQLEQNKRQINKLKKQLSQTRDINTKYQNQLRILRQQNHKKIQYQSVESGKRKLELQATKVELRRKNQQFQKMRENYQQKIQGLQNKIKELNQFITQKQLLAKISNSHMSQ